jgi:preprotein translocase subunit YajC
MDSKIVISFLCGGMAGLSAALFVLQNRRQAKDQATFDQLIEELSKVSASGGVIGHIVSEAINSRDEEQIYKAVQMLIDQKRDAPGMVQLIFGNKVMQLLDAVSPYFKEVKHG